jgi:hypothetical protein
MSKKTAARNGNARTMDRPDPALLRLDVLVGAWTMTGRTLDSAEDNITGTVTIEWLPGGFFMQQRGEMNFMGHKVYSLEIVGYDEVTDTFPSTVYASMAGIPSRYAWDIQGITVIHSGQGAKYTGTFSEGGRILTGGWRPDEGKETSQNVAYDVVMVRVDES